MTPAAEASYYHTIELPDGLHIGQWDCREAVDAYLGGVDFSGCPVLEVGPANGFFSFEMERRGAQVTSLELGPDDSWDMVPGPLIDQPANREYIRRGIESLQAAFWHAHRLLHSRVRMERGTIYSLQESPVVRRIGMLGNVLQHLRDPIGGLMAMAGSVTRTMIVTEALWTDELDGQLAMRFIPSAEDPRIVQSWWQISPMLIGHVLKMLGFAQLRYDFHYSTFDPGTGPQRVRHVTWVGER